MMKTEAEIRRHVRDLALMMDVPCRCAATGHAPECQMGRLILLATAEALGWALGEDEGYQEVVDRFRATAVEVIAAGGIGMPAKKGKGAP